MHRQLRELADVAVGNDELKALLEDPELETRAKEDVLVRIAEGSDEAIVNFVRLLAEKGRAAELGEIADELDALVAESLRILDVQVTTAHELSDTEFGRIVEQIETASGRSVQAARSVDESLIGGIVLQAGSLRLDASVRGRLERLRHDLSTARSQS